MHEVRKTVTVLFADVVASTELGERLDPEALRRVVSRYFAEMAAVLERHGGTVEKFIGDEVMAVFGVPVVHEDDALRAVRAAAAMREKLAELNHELEEGWGARLEIRIGINTGEVVAGDPSAGHGFVTGDAVVLAKRIEQAADPGDILMGDSTFRLVRHTVETTHVGPLSMKGKRETVAPQRLEDVHPDPQALPRRLDAPLVGRGGEVAQLRAAYERAVDERRPQLVTLLGPAGIGKSRVARELLEGVTGEAIVLVGRCLPYGEGITFWPLREILPDESLEGTSEEIFWRIRKRLEELARRRPLVVCFEDLHWAEPTFLDLVQYLAGWIQDAPVLLLCLARPDLLDRRSDWLPPQPEAPVLTLGPLTAEEAGALLDALDVPADARARIADAAEGNPLFVEQMAAMAAEEGASVAVPPSIRALLAERLDRLSREEAAVIERAAIVGREFSLRAVLELMSDERRGRAAADLLALARKELIQPQALQDDDGFRFRHALIRDAAYEAMPKQIRAELHERHADWLARTGAEEILVGYHLEQAVTNRRELGIQDERTRELAGRAGELLGRAGRLAATRGDVPAAVSLLERATALASHPAPLLVELGIALMRSGRFQHADEVLDRALTAARGAGDRVSELRATVERQFVRSFASESRTADENAAVAREVIPELEQLGDALGLAKAWWLMSETAVIEARWGERAESLERALAHARRAPDALHETGAIAALLAQALYHGPTPVVEGVRRCEQLIAEAGRERTIRAGVSSTLAGFHAMQGRFDEARRLYREGVAVYDELGLRFRRATVSPIGAHIESLAGDLEEAERLLREGYETLLEMGARGACSTLAACLADLLAPIGREDDSERFANAARELAEEGDIATHLLWRSALARVLVRRGLDDAADLHASVAIELAERTDSPELKAAAFVAQAELLAGRGSAESGGYIRRALEAYRSKGNLVAAERLAASPPAPSRLGNARSAL